MILATKTAQKIRDFFFEGWKTEFISSAARSERGPRVFLPLFCSAQNLVKKKGGAPGLAPTPGEVGKPTSLRFLIPRVIPSFRARWGVWRLLVSKSLIWVEAKEKDFYKTIREMGPALKEVVNGQFTFDQST